VGALIRCQATEESKWCVVAVRTAQAWFLVFDVRGLRGLSRGEQQLKATQRGSVVTMEQPKGSDAVHALGQHVLEEAPQEFVCGQGHHPLFVGTAVAVPKGDAALVAGDERLVADGGAMDVATEVVENFFCALHDGLREDDPLFRPGYVRKRDARKRTAGKI